MRVFFLILGILCTGLGWLGLVIPPLPATPFFLLAAFCFSRSSDRLHQRLLASTVYHRLIGTMFVRGRNGKRGMTSKRKAFLLALSTVYFAFLFWMLRGTGWRYIILMLWLGECVCFAVIPTVEPN
jgi:uncharacterized membrane protein YbaN (DUF454 family)